MQRQDPIYLYLIIFLSRLIIQRLLLIVEGENYREFKIQTQRLNLKFKSAMLFNPAMLCPHQSEKERQGNPSGSRQIISPQMIKTETVSSHLKKNMSLAACLHGLNPLRVCTQSLHF